jgi:hypothetical protein
MELVEAPNPIFLLTEDVSYIALLTNKKTTHCKTSGNIL